MHHLRILENAGVYKVNSGGPSIYPCGTLSKVLLKVELTNVLLDK